MSASARVLGLAGALLLALGAYWLLPRPAGVDDDVRPLRIVLLDASASVVRTRPAWAAWARAELEREAREARDAGEDVCVVRFAADVERELGPVSADEALDELGRRPLRAPSGASEAGLASRLAAALAFAERALESGGGRVTVLGDALATGEDPAPALARLAAAGVPVTRVAPPPPARPDLALERLVLPETVEAGAPLRASCELAWLGAARAAELLLVVHVEDAGGVRPLALPLQAPARLAPDDPARLVPELDGYVRWRAELDLGPARAGLTVVDARAVVGERRDGGPSDAIPENDEARARTVAEGRLVVLLATPPPARETCERWLAPLAELGVQVRWTAPERVCGELATADALVTVDVAPASLPPCVGAFVREGGGWLACAGARFLAGWVTGDGDGLAALLPLEPDRGRQRPRDVVFLVDGSGSMEGEPFERVRSALADLVGASLPTDRIELVFFTGTPTAPVRLTSGTGRESDAARRAALEELMAARVPGGTTAILYSLEQLAERLERAASSGGEEREGLVLLLSDGRDVQAFDAERRAAELRARFSATRTRLVAIAVGEDADVAFLSGLVGPGEEVLVAGTTGDLSALFQRELHRERRVCGEAQVPVAADAEAGTLASALLAGAAAGTPVAPALECFVRAVRGPTGEVVWRGPEGEPVCAVQRVGLGRTGAFASAPLPGWAPAWSEGGAGAIGPLVRLLARDANARGRDRGRARVERGRLVVEGLATRAATLAGELADARGAPLGPIRLTAEVAPLGEASLHVAPWTLEGLASGELVELRLPGLPDEPALAFAAPRAPELAAPIAWRPRAPGPRPEDTEGPGGDGRAPRRAGPIALAAGLLALSAGVLLGLARARTG